MKTQNFIRLKMLLLTTLGSYGSMLALSVGGHGLDPWPSRTENLKICNHCFSTKYAILKR